MAAPAAAPLPSTQVPGSTPAQPVAVSDDVAALQRQIEELKSRQSGADRARADTEALLREQLENAQFMQNRLRELAEENQRLKTGGGDPKPAAAPDEAELKLEVATEGFTEDEERHFGERTKKYVTKVIRAEVASILGPIVAKINSLSAFNGTTKKQLEDVTAATTAIAPIALRSAEREFYEKEIVKHFQDFGARRTSPEWKAFLTRIDPSMRVPYGAILQEASLRFDGPGARRVLTAFYEEHPSAAAPAGTAGISIEAPSSAGTGSSVGAPGIAQVPKFKYSVYTEAFRKWQKAPKNPQIRQEYDKVKAQYDAAMSAGNVDFNS